MMSWHKLFNLSRSGLHLHIWIFFQGQIASLGGVVYSIRGVSFGVIESEVLLEVFLDLKFDFQFLFYILWIGLNSFRFYFTYWVAASFIFLGGGGMGFSLGRTGFLVKQRFLFLIWWRTYLRIDAYIWLFWFTGSTYSDLFEYKQSHQSTKKYFFSTNSST